MAVGWYEAYWWDTQTLAEWFLQTVSPRRVAVSTWRRCRDDGPWRGNVGRVGGHDLLWVLLARKLERKTRQERERGRERERGGGVERRRNGLTETENMTRNVQSNLFKAGPFDLSFWSFLTFLHHAIEKVGRHLLWKLHKKNSKEKLVKCATEVARLYSVSIEKLYTKSAVSESSIDLTRLNF